MTGSLTRAVTPFLLVLALGLGWTPVTLAAEETAPTAVTTSAGVTPRVVTSLTFQPVTTVPAGALALSIGDATERALRRNKVLAIRKLDPSIARAKVLRELGAFDETVNLQLQRQHNQIPSASIFAAGISETDTRLANLGYATRFREGTQVQTGLNNTRNENNFRSSSINPNYNSNLYVTATHPLLRGAGRRVVNANVSIAENGVVQGHLRLKKQILDTVAVVEKQYWDLVFARQDLEVKRFNLQAARELLAFNRSRQEAGLGSEVQVVEAEASEATRTDELRVSERVIQDAQEILRRTISLDERKAGSPIVPTATPACPPRPAPLEKELEIAFAERPDYRDLLIELENKDLRVWYLKSYKRPRVDLTATYQRNGLSGDWDDSLSQVSSGAYPGYTVGFQVELPLTNRTARGDYQQGVLEKRQALLSVKAIEDQIEEEVTRAHRSLETNLDRVDVSRRAAVLSERQLKAAVARYQQGLIANFDLLRYQQDLADARSRSLRALLDAINSWLNLGASTSELLAARNIVVDQVELEGVRAPSAVPGRPEQGFSAPGDPKRAGAR